MRAALARLSTLVAADIRQVAHEAKLARLPPDRFILSGIELELGAWATPNVRNALYAGIYEQPEREVLLASLKPDDVVLEVGAGCGFITTVAAGLAREVRSFDANPELVPFARATVAHNGRTATVENAVLAREPAAETVPFHVATEFWTSSLLPVPGARVVDVPLLDFSTARDGCSYLIVDIEGGEIELLGGDLSGVRAICVECHPALVGARQITKMLASLFEQGFALDLAVSRGLVLYLSRD
jgi:FkbM family methyltransferase